MQQFHKNQYEESNIGRPLSKDNI